ncbi:thiolase C-terminal domain-containing protein [Burkholderia sp. BCC1993]|uniref:thiolase C-terminal domain-containing protein n=1 Tax=Burkholderia sp. BCC1993 TaxID=2817444 RepID=UPI002AB12E40|nr:lipid-transfer protein [Burkholderia sp. BCC1993]
MFKDATAIVGIGQTRFAKGLADTELELACQAVEAALADSGIAAHEVDALGSYTMEDTPEFELARQMGFGPLHFFSRVHYGGGAGPGAVGQVALAIAAGVARVGVVWRSRKRADPSSRVWANTAATVSDHWKWSRPSGLLRPVDEVALLAQRYFHEHGDARDALAEIAMQQRRYANVNSAACMRDKPLSRDDYFRARMIADPLCLFDNCLESDGAVALVITGAQRAADCREKPALIHAFSQGLAPGHQLMTDYHRDDPFDSCSATTAANLWRQSDFGPMDVDVAQIYDAFSPLVLFSLESYGFCKRGAGADFVRAGQLGPRGQLPTNTSGGSLSEAYIHGMNLIAEGVRQLRGQASTQIADARICLVTGCDSTPNGALLLRSAP